MPSIKYISSVADGLVRKHKTRDPYELCDALGIRVRLKDLGADIKAYYFYQSKIRNIVLNVRASEIIRKVLVAHELGHDRLHREIAMLMGFPEIELFGMKKPMELEANIFAAEILIEDSALLELLKDCEKSFFDIAKELCIPAALLDFKFRALQSKGHNIEAPYIANGNFLKNEITENDENAE